MFYRRRFFVPASKQPDCAAARKPAVGGFTLLELVLVLAVLVMIVALAWPVLQGVYQIRQLKAVASEVRAAWTEARNGAMDAGESWAFQFVPDDNTYKIGMYPPSDAPPAALAAPFRQQTTSAQEIVERLPEPFVFGVSSIEDERAQAQQLATTAPAAAGRAATAGRNFAGQNAAGTNPAAQWSPPIMFYPDGTASDAQLVITDKRGLYITLVLRAATGTSRASDVWREGASP